MQSLTKSHTFVISIKKKTLGFFKYILNVTLDLRHFNLVNEISRTMKIRDQDDKTFELKMRVRQSFQQKEKEIVNVRDFKIKMLF